MADLFEIDFVNNYTYENVADLGTGKVSSNTTKKFSFTIGTGDNSADTIFRDQFELRTGNSWTTTFDLTALVDFYGVTKNYSKVKSIYVKNTSDGTTITGTIEILEDAANNFKGPLGVIVGSEIVILPNDTYQQSNRKGGWPVDGTNKILTISNAVNDNADFDIIIIGVAT